MNQTIALPIRLSLILVCFTLAKAAGAVGGDEIPPLGLHAFAESDPLLAGRYRDPDGFYSIRPPAGWKRVAAASRGNEKEPWRWRVLFRGTQMGDALEVGVVNVGPPSLDKVSLSRYMGDFTSELRRRPGLRVEDDGLYLCDQFVCIRVRGREKSRHLTWFLVFGTEPAGEHLQVVLSDGPGHPARYGKVLEACLASIHWPDLDRGR